MPMLSPSGKRNKIANYMDSLPEEFDVVEDMMGEKNPTAAMVPACENCLAPREREI